MSKRKGDKSAAQTSVAPTPVERPPTPEAEAVEGALSLADWERHVEAEGANILCAAAARTAVERAADVIREQYLEEEEIPLCLAMAQHIANALVEIKFVSLDAGDSPRATYDLDKEPEASPVESYFTAPGRCCSIAVSEVEAQPTIEVAPGKRFMCDVAEAAAKRMEDKMEVSTRADATLHSLHQEATRVRTDTPDGRPSKQQTGPTRKRRESSEALSGPVGEVHRAGLKAEQPRTLVEVEAKVLAMTRKLERTALHNDLLTMGSTMTAQQQRADEPHEVEQAEGPANAKVQSLQERLDKQEAARQEHFTSLGYPQVADAAGPLFPQPPLDRHIDFSVAYKRVVQEERDKRVERQRAQALQQEQASVPRESFAAIREQYQRERAREMASTERINRQTRQTIQNVSAPRQVTGLTAEQRKALGLDKDGRPKLRDIPLRGRVAPLKESSASWTA